MKCFCLVNYLLTLGYLFFYEDIEDEGIDKGDSDNDNQYQKTQI